MMPNERTDPTIATAERTAPCPWCGNIDHELHTREFINTGEDGSVSIVRHVAVVCESCRARGAYGLSRSDTVSYWNRVAQDVAYARECQQGANEATDREEHAAEQARMEGLLPDTARGGQ